MRLPRPNISSMDALMWFGVLGAPFAWTVQFVVGYASLEAACNAAGQRWGVSPHAYTLTATIVGTVIAVLAGLAAIHAFRATRGSAGEGGSDEAPPKGRIHFMATVGITITPLFLFIILMGGLGATFFPPCHQG